MRIIKHIGVMTSGGDAPGMNAAIRAVVRSALDRKVRVSGIGRGYRGLIEGDIFFMDSRSVGGIINRGGTILRTVRCPEYRDKKNREKGYASLRAAGIDALVVIGGNGSSAAAYTTHQEMKIPVAVVPASIDNDVYGSDDTVGFDTVVNTAVDAIDKIRDTATSHERIFVIEVMGRENGFIALEVGLASGAEAVLVPEIPYDLKRITQSLTKGHARGKVSSIVVMAEGAGDSRKVVEEIACYSKLDIRLSVLGYIQRGGSPSSHSRILAGRLGHFAVQNLMAGFHAHLAAIQDNALKQVPLTLSVKRTKRIDHAIYHLTNSLAQ
jgi:6-phosphofructokinase 1